MPVARTRLSLVASVKLHGLNREDYLRDFLRVLPSSASHRVLELAPKYGRATRERTLGSSGLRPHADADETRLADRIQTPRQDLLLGE